MGKIMYNGVEYSGAIERMSDLSDVSVSTPQNKQVIKYNSVTQKWENGVGSSFYAFTQDEWDDIEDKSPYYDSLVVLTDAPNLNATANDLSMGSAPYASGTVGECLNMGITFTPATGLTEGHTLKQVNLSVFFSINFILTASVGAWVNIGAISGKPTTTVYSAVVNTDTGAYAGMLQITTNGEVRFYPVITLTNQRCGTSVCYSG